MKSNKKKVLGVFNDSLETYTRHSLVADEEQKNKKGHKCFYGSL